MTRITKITLQGFKSFNKKISIPFVPGVNIICGPNGSGKSNIVDSICFVLGRTSAKSLRADRLHELIFHGAGIKKPADYASVTLYLDNSKKTFPFDDPEISITRKVNRKGVSVFKINGKTTTREKILELLSSARIYPDGHNIILQGDVTNIIEMNPIERRQIIDEISGIAEYNDKKEKAKRDLEFVEQKLKEAEIIISQKYDIFKKLEEERNAAIKYQDLQKKLLILKASYAYKKMKNCEAELEKLEVGLFTKEEQIKRNDEDIRKIEEELEKKENEIRAIANRVVEISKKIKIEKKLSELRSQILLKKERISSNLREIERIDSLIEKLEALIAQKTEFYELPRAVAAILDLNLKGVYGIVRDLINVPEKYKVAIEVAAGPHLYDIIVENEDVATYCIEYLKKEKIGRAVFLPLNKIKPILFKDNELLNKKGVIGIASGLIKYPTKFMNAIEFVFGNTLVVENLDVAKELIGKARVVTLDGELIEKSGAIIGGYYAKVHSATIENVKKEIENYIKIRKNLQIETEKLRAEVAELEKRIADFELLPETKEIIDLEKIRIVSEKEIEELKQRRRIAYEKRIKLQSEIDKIRMEKARLEAEHNIAMSEVQQYGEVKYIDEKLTVLGNLIQKVIKELNAIGPVNLRAIEEYEKFAQEFDEYKKKYEKILEEKKAVLRMIEEIEAKRKETFYKCLERVNEEFKKIFYEMLKGNANLELENPMDIESGLLIQANPRGKMLLNIDTMSGGEKTLTALAFLFAIQSYKPAPFYILDEIDAALDKENTKIMAELIKRHSKDAQFIVITHNDQTIKYGDVVYGCTMVDGETKILGLRLPA